MIKVHFHKKKYKWWNPLKYTTSIIKIFSNDIYYHVSFEENKKYYESEFFSGVVRYANPRNDIAHTIELNINKPTTKKIIKEFESMLGKKYDFFGVVFGFFGHKVHESDKYFCSELFLPILKHAYNITKDDLKTNLSPKDVRMICFGLTAKRAK
jgi:hypothetical protein|tara:strand:+ start:130 stop:591 length:462 start_codon:yes stop_codon:yes gene_type:complete